MPKIGQRLRGLRDRRKLTVRVLALRSGVSHSTISLIERDRISPSIDTLGAILDALGTTLGNFLSEDIYTIVDPFYHGSELPEIGREDQVSYKIIGLNFPARHLQMLKETYRPNADTGGGLMHSAQEAGYIISGAIEVTVGDKCAVLEAGDAYYFDSRLPHRFRNVGKGDAEIVSAITPPNY